jgi:hypothetical protein
MTITNRIVAVPKEANPNSKEWKAGYSAGRNGKSSKSPHVKGTQKEIDWTDGWITGDHERNSPPPKSTKDVLGYSIQDRLERLRQRRGDPPDVWYTHETAVPSKSVYYVLRRLFKTLFPHGGAGDVPPYGTNICHGRVAEAIKRRNYNPEDKIWLYGASGGDVMHSVLTDEHNRVILDPWAGSGNAFGGRDGYGKPGDMLDCLWVETVAGLQDEFGI